MTRGKILEDGLVAPRMTQPRRVFLAHAREDKERVRALYKEIKQRGFNPWLDEEDLIPGQTWAIEIQKAIREAGAFIACLSQISVQKQGYVQTEFRLALTAYGEKPAGAIYFIPVRLDECEIPDLQIPNRGLSIREFHWLDLWQEGGFERLIQALEKGLGTTGRAILKPGTVFHDIDAPWCPEMVALPVGEFLMGSPKNEEGRHSDEGPQHLVTISRSFALGRCPVTFEQYDYFCAATRREKPGDEGWGRSRRPVINVSWWDAEAYIGWLAGATGEPYRLPSEAEWEYACRAGTTAPFSFGETITPEQVNYNGNHPYKGGKEGRYRQETVPVASLPANSWGLYEMHGNVWEWCADGRRSCTAEAVSDPMGPTESSASRVLRGGSWRADAHRVRSAARGGRDLGYRGLSLGFRCARAQEA